MINIEELLFQSALRTDILKVAFNLMTDPGYTKEDVIEDLLKLLPKHDL